MDFPPDHTNGNGTTKRRRVGLAYDERMCKHSTPDGEPHVENPERIRAVWNKLVSAGITKRCMVFDAKEVEDKYIAAVHTDNHINVIKTISSKRTAAHRKGVAAKFDSIYFNEGSSESANLAAGSVLEAAEKVAKGELSSAFAIVRPPGHHAEENEPMGFCLYNNVAIATSFLLNEKELGINKILIVDWDIHHGNGTQQMFWKDPRVLCFSVHRYENGSFYPGGDDGSHVMVGEGPGTGYNINVPWGKGQRGDADYNAVWDHILIPVAREFNPDIILIAAGFDAALGDPVGDCLVTPHGYSVLLKKLMEFSEGKIVMALEGGYDLDSLANSVLACMEVLLEEKSIVESTDVYPFESTWRVIKSVREKLSTFWPILVRKLPRKLTSLVTPQLQVYSSQSEDEYDDGPDALLDDFQEDVTIPLSKREFSKYIQDEVTAASSETHHLQALISRKRQESSVQKSSSNNGKKQKVLDILDSHTFEKERHTQMEETSAPNGTLDHLDNRQRITIEESDKLLAERVENHTQIKELKGQLLSKENEIEVLKQQLNDAQTKEVLWVEERKKKRKALKTLKAERTEALARTHEAENDRHLLLTEHIPKIFQNLLHSSEFLYTSVKMVRLAIKFGRQQGLERIHKKMLPYVSLEKMHGYDDSITQRFDEALEEYDNMKTFSYLQEIAANANKPLKDIMEITPS